MEKLYFYFKDARNMAIIKKLILDCELEFLEDKEQKKQLKSNKSEIKNRVKEYFNDNNFKFTFCLTKQEILSNNISIKIQALINNLEKNGIKKSNLIFTVLDNSHSFKKDEWKKILDLNVLLKKQNIKFGFEDHGKTWELAKVENANRQIQNAANYINSKQLSPFEKIMSAYFLVTSRVYIEESEKEHFAKSRSIYGILNSDNIVCVGYSEWLAAILNLTKDENIIIYQNGVQISRDNKYIDGAHRNTVIYVKDKKYNLDGYYYVDATWDTTHKQNETIYSLNNFMLPLTDIGEYIDYIRADALFLYMPPLELDFIKPPKNKKDVLNAHNKNIEYEYASLLNEKHEAQFGMSDDNNNVSFSTDNYYFDGSFMNDFKKHYMQFNTYKDFSKEKLSIGIDLLNDIIDRNNDIKNNLDFIKQQLIKYNKTTLSNREINTIAKSENYIDTIVEIICTTKLDKTKQLPIDEAFKKLNVKLEKQQKELEEEVNYILEEKYNENFNENNFSFYTEPVIEKTIKYLSTPIPLNKYKHALKEYFAKFSELSAEEIDEKVNAIIDNNIFNSVSLQKETAQNAFIKASTEKYGFLKQQDNNSAENEQE